MNALDQADIDRIERERQRREREFLLLLLVLIGDTRRDAVRAAKLGRDSAAIGRNTFLGHEQTIHEGAAPIIAEQMAHATVEGVRRAHQLAGVIPPRVDAATMAGIANGYNAEATDMAGRIWAVIEEKLQPAFDLARFGTVADTTKAIRLAFKESGVTKADPSTLEKGVERQVIRSHNAGLWFGGSLITDSLHHLVGFRHVSVMDDATTPICRARNRFQRPASDPYWRTNFPPLHWNCRSVVMPLFGANLEPSTLIPSEPPAPGFGLAPSIDLGSYFGVTRG